MRILFQGDSITDAGRSRENPHLLGEGYPKYAAQYLKENHPEIEFDFVNLGISGNRTKDLVARWQEDCIDIQPDVVSIMIGINDTWRAFDSNDPTSIEEFEANYRKLLEEIRAKTDAYILLIEPFLLPVDPSKDGYRVDLDPKITVVRKMAHEYADAYLPTDGLLAAACVNGIEASTWSADGVHLNEAGSKLVGEYYANVIEQFLDQDE